MSCSAEAGSPYPFEDGQPNRAFRVTLYLSINAGGSLKGQPPRSPSTDLLTSFTKKIDAIDIEHDFNQGKLHALSLLDPTRHYHGRTAAAPVFFVVDDDGLRGFDEA